MNTAGVEYHNIFTSYLWWIVIECDGDGISRGYTGHEMLPEFGIINMNGRLYDPLLGRFFSPDNYVQLLDFAQSYNRYSYCLNNPLKYTDPSGELFGIDDAVFAFAAFNVASSMMQAAANGQNIWKAGAFSLLSSAASFGIGQLFGSAGSVGRELLRAGAHGIASGIFNVLGGGDFGNGFAAGATASGLGSFAQGVKMRPGMMVLTTSVAGGVAAWASGGNFLKGALQGLTIGFFNHGMHSKIYKDAHGEYRCDLEGIECTPKNQMKEIIETSAWINTIVGPIGTGLKDYSENSTFGSNGKFYFHNNSERPFYGNQYVKTINLSKVGAAISKASGPITVITGAYDFKQNFQKDLIDYNNGYTAGQNSVRSVVNITCGYYGAVFGAKIGAAIGAPLCGFGAIPGAIIGSAVGGILFSIGGSWLGTSTVDFIYDTFVY